MITFLKLLNGFLLTLLGTAAETRRILFSVEPNFAVALLPCLRTYLVSCAQADEALLNTHKNDACKCKCASS
jgi:hypothetical protein